ncbi:hypothetical protein F443_20055 [Plasmopara halstedii]|uniref:DHHA2 domain-containing protein n=1 Tax=Plasmopara halstedii TaxID=4781 RepID=A0A0P1AAK1_PLAHL|nr:hypothetical protein F443_20055 [Plasmopara halstedii]CEG37274.1 hypothetical protein F443_20055 [Plasmopara halstedii]|eukprot:XP_024573643.1 hypothetical protein F443_20055 [Plasmopara halstedii]
MHLRLLRLPLHIGTMSFSSCIWHTDSAAARYSSVALFNDFLRSTRCTLKNSPAPTSVHVLIGNEAADADSIVSSLSYAYLNHQQKPELLHVPVLPIPRSELILRCDVSALFQKLGVDTDALVFVDEFPWELQSKITVTLMDHNAMSNKKIPHAHNFQVVEIVDHHSDQGQHLDAKKREVAFANGNALVASTCTLVVERMIKIKSDDVHKLLATMLLGVISLDSINFDPSAKKVTPRDVKAAGILEPMAFADKEALFKWLQTEKFDPVHWHAFSLVNCLQADYKEFKFTTAAGDATKVGISAILIDFETFVRKTKDAAELCQRLSEFCKQNGIVFLVIMTIFITPDKERHRQLAFFQKVGNDAKHCVEKLKKERTLQMEPLILPELHRDNHVIAFNQLNSSASRKQVAPMILRALADPGQVASK